MPSFNRSQIKEYIARVENGLATFPGYEMDVAKLAGFVSGQVAAGNVERAEAEALLQAAYRLGQRAQTGHTFGKWCRRPPADLEVMVLSDHGIETQEA